VTAAAAVRTGNILELAGVTARYGAGAVLHGIDLVVERGSIVALLGANGAGKTTTFRAITGAIATGGSIRIDGQAVQHGSPEGAARLGIAHVPEGRGTLASFSVWENLSLGAFTQRDKKRTQAAYERVVSYFPKLAQRRNQIAGTLSGGEQQMLAIGRALMMEPRLMLLDEPSLGIAPIVVREIFELLATINRNDGVTILVAEQNASLALAVAGHAYVLETGRIAVSGTAAELRDDDAVRRSYLGY
jgi:branched-chain amino acid transport system ATP-binding protein